MKILYIVRGLPGAGKTTLANHLCDYVVSADDFFTTNGKYKFDGNKIKEAHNWCQDSVETQMVLQTSQIAVANTFTQEWEMLPYENMAKLHGYTVFHIIVENRHGSTNIHDVPADIIAKMKERFSVKL